MVRLQLGYEELIEHDPSYESTLKIWEGKFGINVASGEAERVIAYVRDAPGCASPASTTTSRSPASPATTRSRSRPGITAT